MVMNNFPSGTRRAGDMLEILRDAVDMEGGQRAWGRATGIDPAEVSKVLNRHKPITEPMINALGYVTQVVCVPMRETNR